MVRRRLLHDGDQSSNDVSPNILITVLVLAIAVILSASFYLLLRFLRRHNHHRHHHNTPTHDNLPHPLSSRTRHVISRRVTPANKTHNPLMDALPLFKSDSLKTTADCAVCLSKFEKDDLLRLLPICCHVFHADCIDTWLNSNQSCPLCRSPVFLPDSELLPKLNPEHDTSSLSSGSFRVEIGNVSRRNDNNSGELPVRRSYSLGGNFDYIVDDDVVSEVYSGSFRRTSSTTEFKVDSDNNNNSQQLQQQGSLAAEVGTRGGGGWLKDYLTHSLSSSFRSSGRWFFTGSSRRETTTTTPTTMTNEYGASEMDIEASRLGDEIGELFRWLSGV